MEPNGAAWKPLRHVHPQCAPLPSHSTPIQVEALCWVWIRIRVVVGVGVGGKQQQRQRQRRRRRRQSIEVWPEWQRRSRRHWPISLSQRSYREWENEWASEREREGSRAECAGESERQRTRANIAVSFACAVAATAAATTTTTVAMKTKWNWRRAKTKRRREGGRGRGEWRNMTRRWSSRQRQQWRTSWDTNVSVRQLLAHRYTHTRTVELCLSIDNWLPLRALHSLAHCLPRQSVLLSIRLPDSPSPPLAVVLYAFSYLPRANLPLMPEQTLRRTHTHLRYKCICFWQCQLACGSFLCCCCFARQPRFVCPQHAACLTLYLQDTRARQAIALL